MRARSDRIPRMSDVPEAPKELGAKFWIGLLIVFIIGGVLAFAGRRAYKVYRPARLALTAMDLQAKGDFHNATLTALRVLQMDPNNFNATRAIAQMADKAGSYEALFWWRRVQELKLSRADSLAWVASALRFGEYPLAQKALETVPEAERKCADYESSAASIAIAIHQPEEAERHYAAALKFEPENPLRQFDLAGLQLRSKDPKTASQGRASLQRLVANPKYRLPAMRALIVDLMAHNRFETACVQARSLENEKEARFSDRVLVLDLLWNTVDPKWEPYFESLKAQADPTTEDIGLLMSWANRRGLPSLAIEWAERLKPETIHGPPAGIALAESYLQARQWHGLADLTEESNWAGMEYLRRVYLAKALRELGDKDGFLAQWNSALTAATKRRDALLRLSGIVSGWGWDEPLITLLWTVSNSPSNQDWALQQLYRHYSKNKDTRGLYQVASRMMEIDPDNEKIRNNSAVLGLLLKSNISRAYRISGDLYLKHPTDPVFVSTYAYALHMRGKSQEGLEVLEKLSPSQLDQADIALYHGALLASTSQMEKAEACFARVKTADLLAEETEIIEKARQPEAVQQSN